MKRCFSKSLIRTPQPGHHWGPRTSPRVISRKSAVKQLSNIELLEIALQVKQDCTSIKKPQIETHKLDSQHHDIFAQTAPPLTAHPSQLPQSPLIDPTLIAARIRHRTVKPLPSGSLSPFQSKLQKNPFGMHAPIYRTRNLADQCRSHCISNSTTTMHPNRYPTAKLLPDPIWSRNTSEHWGTMAPSQASNSSSVQPRRRRDL